MSRGSYCNPTPSPGKSQGEKVSKNLSYVIIVNYCWGRGCYMHAYEPRSTEVAYSPATNKMYGF